MIIDRFFDTVAKRGPVCVGLDTSLKLLPQSLATELPTTEAVLEFNRRIIDATLDLVACYKVQIAHYEALGVDGLSCYRDTLAYARGKNAIVIGDIKRGDIASTGEMYARAHLSGDFEADSVTVNPYMGFDAIRPYLPYLKEGEKGIFVLIRTSNPSAKDFQGLSCPNRPLFLHVAEHVRHWGEEYLGECGYSLIGGVVGATHPQELAMVREAFPSLFLLVPGYGAQGGGGREVAPAFVQGNGAVVNASRSILGAHRGRPDGERRYAEYAREAVLAMREDIKRWVK
jgi:orotidine-5'-phosphate decarboxylase